MFYRQALQGLTVKELIRAIGSDRLTSKEKRSRTHLENAVENTYAFQNFVVEAYEEKVKRREEDEQGRVKRCRFLDEGSFHPVNDEDEFLTCVDDDVSNAATKAFIDRTGNKNMEQTTCAVCAGEFFQLETEKRLLEELEHKDLLRPSHAHPSQRLYFGMLLYEDAVSIEDGEYWGHICHSCFNDLKAGKLPSCALANNLWIGVVPHELSILSLPEQVLISRYYAASYIVKLYPRSRGAQSSSGQAFNSALRGNVASYRINTTEVARMIEGEFLPHHPNILAATIGVTLVGAKNVPDRSLPGFLRVSRERIRDALVFLKNNNPFYENIQISEENLSLLPDNSIPGQLLAVVKELPNANIIEEVDGGYIIEDDEDEELNESIDDELGEGIGIEEEDVNTMEEAPTVIPLRANGVIDPGMSDVRDDELLGCAMQNTANGSDEKYVVRRGSNFVNEYGRRTNEGEPMPGDEDHPNHLLGAFPSLFPYGCGGFEVDRPRKLSYAEHVRWALRYADKRFRLDIRFVFQVFGVLQKRQVCRSTCLQIKKADYHRYEEQIRQIDARTLVQSGQEEKEGKPITSVAVRALKRHTTAVRSRVMATDESRRGVRSLIWGMTILKSPPSLWITLNPSDIHDPIAQILAGSEINLDQFDNTAGPDATSRLCRIANDPYAASRFFHFLIDVLLEEIFGIQKATMHKDLIRRTSVFGKIEGYIGTVEAQGRGTLHLHMIIWLSGAPSYPRMKELLRSDRFRERVVSYIAKHIKAHHSSLTPESLSRVPKESAVTYSRPVDPSLDIHNTQLDEHLRKLVRAVQMHTCSPACRKVKDGRVVCKRKAPFQLSDHSWIDAEGNWGPKRTIPFMNGWNPWLLNCLRANHDIKLIPNGEATKNLSFYITAYAAKNQQRSSNTSALLAKAFMYKTRLLSDKDLTTVQQLNKRLIQRCANTLTREQELSAPEVISYLMGWGDRYISHQFVPIHMNSLVRQLKSRWPFLDNERDELEFTSEGELRNVTSEETDNMILRCDPDGQLLLHDQLREYIDRNERLKDLSVFDFFRHTYDAPAPVKEENSVHKRDHNPTFPYLPNTGHDNRHRVLRKQNHETMITFPGMWFPRSNDDNKRLLYYASVLALFKPWSTITDIKPADETFEEAYNCFIGSAPPSINHVLDNIQFFYESSDRAREKTGENVTFDNVEEERINKDSADEANVEMDEENCMDKTTEQQIDEALTDHFSAREAVYSDIALNLASEFKIFDVTNAIDPPLLTATNATQDQLSCLEIWTQKMSNLESQRGSRFDDESCEDSGGIESETDVSMFDEGGVSTTQDGNITTPVNEQLQSLNEDQKMAFTILSNHLRGDVPDEAKKPLLMIVTGSGGTGKTKLLSTLAADLDSRGELSSFARTATTGVASCLIGGSTLHSWAGIPARKVPRSDKWATHPSPRMAERRERNILGKKLLGVDELSLLTTETLANLAKVICIVNARHGDIDISNPFADLSVLLTGDIHQFPPVAQLRKALYTRNPQNALSELGKFIFERFETVVTLKQQMRIVDETWDAIMTRARYGHCTTSDINEIRRLVLVNPECEVPKFNEHPWDDVILITPRNCVRSRWNIASIHKHCKATGHILYLSPAEDTIGNRPTSTLERLQCARLPVEKTANLPMKTILSEGMKVMITENVAPTANLANGSRGTIKSIVLDEREPLHEPIEVSTGLFTIALRYPPSYVTISMTFTEIPQLHSLEKKELPLAPLSRTFRTSSKPSHTVRRRQLPLTAAYAFTDFKSQGQTLDNVLVDIGKTYNFSLTPFNAYVSLSRAKSRNQIRLLRDFEDKLFTTPPSEDLIEQDRILEEKAERTKKEYLEGKHGQPHAF